MPAQLIPLRPPSSVRTVRTQKPPGCLGCPLDEKGSGFVSPEGPEGAAILFVGEAPGFDEVAIGRPFVGAAGSMFSRLLRMAGIEREAVRVGNAIQCFLGDTAVEARGVAKAYRRSYSGEVVTLTTREGQLTCTPNHPVLSQQGWIAAGLLDEGDYLVRGEFREGMCGSDPDVHDVPPQFAESFDALRHQGSRQWMVGRDMDFHGDGSEAEIEVVTFDRLLRDWAEAAHAQHSNQGVLEPTDHREAFLLSYRQSAAVLFDVGSAALAASGAVVGGSHLRETLVGREPIPVQLGGFSTASGADSHRAQCIAQPRLADAELMGERLNPFPRFVAVSEILKVEWSRVTMAHVYNLQTVSEEYTANGFIVHNCAPPKLWFDARAPYYHGALQHCRQYTQPLLDEGARVIVPVGATAIRRVLGLSGKHTGPEALHGTVTTLPSGQFVVPSFHPSHLQRGAANLTGTVVWDLQRALEISTNGWQPDLMELIEDPPIEWLDLWIDQLEAAVRADPYGVWCTVDIETPDTKGRNEDELGEDDQSYQIERVNFASHPDEGLTVPYVGPYIQRVERVLRLLQVAVMWYGDYDKPRLARAGHTIPPIVHDGMWMAKMLQSDLPGALGFWAPFYSKFQLDGYLGAWKHLSGVRPVTYAAIDGPQELRCVFGMARDLQAHGQWDAYERHQRRLDQIVLKPCSAVGVPVDREKLEAFRAELTVKARRLLHSLQGEVPEELRPLTPKEGLSRPPAPTDVHTKGRSTTKKGVPKKDAPDSLKQDLYAQSAVVVEKIVLRSIKVCVSCGAQEVSVKHRCENRQLQPKIELHPASVRRWFWLEPFNPDSAPQILAWLKHHKHPVGKSKTSDESTDKKTLEANLAKTGHPFYKMLLDYRAIKKVLSTYVEGTLKRLDANDRLHPHFTFKPSTQRLSATAPNIQNVVADRGGKEAMASGFRKCIVARESEPEATEEYVRRWG